MNRLLAPVDKPKRKMTAARIAGNARYRERNKDKIRARLAVKYKENRDAILKRQVSYYKKRMQEPEYKERFLRLTREYRKKTKISVIQQYGGKCACCSEETIEFMSIDHIDGNGADHRRKVGNDGGYPFYLWLIRNNFPQGFQVLCHNCNVAKGQFGTCPHRRTAL